MWWGMVEGACLGKHQAVIEERDDEKMTFMMLIVTAWGDPERI